MKAASRRSILLIDDDVQNLSLLTEILASRYEVRSASDPRLGVASAVSDPPSLVVCDIDMPGMNGFEVCEAIRAALPSASAAQLPIVFLTSDPQASSMRHALAAGGSDYLLKPFRVKELVERIELRLGLALAGGPLRCGNLTLDFAQLRAFVEHRGKTESLRLTELGFRVLEVLARNEGRLLSREQLMNDVWSGSGDASDRAVDLHVFRLRKLLRHWDREIETVYGRGYCVVEKARKPKSARNTP
jgi:DNA-binding response OmpR family regulator